MSDSLLSIENLNVSFRTEEGRAEVINGLDLALDRGETVGIVGETGCGKSVTAKTILGLLPENAEIPEGRVALDGENVLELPDGQRHAMRGKRVSMIMQDPMTSLNPVFTVGEQMVDVLKWQGRERVSITGWLRDKFRDDADLRERALEMLEEVQISAPDRVFDSYPVELSGGMRQRVLIAIALLLEPDLLIADEPGTALDVTTESKILDLLEDLTETRDTGVLYITHDLGVAKEICDRINVMYAGEIVEEAATAELFASPDHPYTRGLLDSIPRLAEEMGSGMAGGLPSYIDPPTGCRFAPRCPYAEPECSEYVPYRRTHREDHSVACHMFEGEATYEHEALLAEQVDEHVDQSDFDDDPRPVVEGER
ncbi:ABC transporter ATP-binding protein [Halovivax limisalsi]|uniref:ABC transporter ATP-binding protein n=1 Tax=Halovivax limisalsi TaxID=1453760 RepID=UPI001FFDD843|nr:ABC transporter ATP-binding protein [Halovivax limisalsi]